jgi:phosphoribosylformimino-5-aminoimidazole carboxamide ribotide isomerase
MNVIPAIDLREGRVVRLAQGDYERQTQYSVDPLQLACAYLAAGATWLHVVDLDGARAGHLHNLRVIASIANSGLSLQAGGGVRDEDDLNRLFDAGVSRVVVGSVAVTEPDKVEKWILRHGADRICVALDTRQVDDGSWTLPVRGWTSASIRTLDELAPRYANSGAAHLLCTDIARDGMLKGPNVELYEHLVRIAPALAIQASGGVRDASDIRALQSLGLSGVILGRSLLEGRLTLAEALSC